MNAPVKPKIGQVWQDNDPRFRSGPPRLLTIVEIDRFGYATCQVENRKGKLRRTFIRLDRFKPTGSGYKLVQDMP